MYELTEVSKLYRQGGATIHAVDSVDLKIQEGEFVVVEGASGSGKTTLLQLLGALDRPTSGSVFFEGDDLGSLHDKALANLRLRAFGFVFQQFNLIPTLNARENVEAALAPTGMKKSNRRKRSQEVLEEVGLDPRWSHLPTQLSGGEQQRVAIARALSNNPRVVLADEPTGNLDSRTGEEIVRLLAKVSTEQNRTVILVTHNRLVGSLADRVLHMRDGSFVNGDGAGLTMGV